MTVAYLINQYPQTSQSFIRREIAGLEAEGIRVERFTLRRWDAELVDPDDRAERDRTRAVLEVGAAGLLWAMMRAFFSRPMPFIRALRMAWRVGKQSDRGLWVHFIYLAEACVLVKWLAECGAVHLHAHFGTNSTTVAMLCRELGSVPYSFTSHGPEEYDRVATIALAEKTRRAAFVVAISEFGRSQLYRWVERRHWEKIAVVRCGVDSAFIDGAASPLPESRRLVCVGRIAEQKGQLVLMQAAAKLAADGVDFELLLVGDGPMRGDVEQFIAEHNLHNRVRIGGWMSNQQVRQEVAASRAMVLPSFAEGLPVVIMEALALGRPVISTYVAGIPELVQPGISGWLVPAGAVEPLADAMRQALEAPAGQLEQMGRAGAEQVRRRHDARIEARKLAELFRNHAQPRMEQ